MEVVARDVAEPLNLTQSQAYLSHQFDTKYPRDQVKFGSPLSTPKGRTQNDPLFIQIPQTRK